MVSFKDIAKQCGVSIATVSKALNDQRDIGEETKARIKKVANEMGYLEIYGSCMTAYGIHVYNFKLKKFAWAFIMPIMKPAVATQEIFRCIGLVFGKKLCYTVKRCKPRKTRS